jgi:uncharacterized protein YcgI (DUF1989 family)
MERVRRFPVPPLDKPFYENLRDKRETFALVERFIIPKESGKACLVRRGQVARVIAVEGPQIADIDFFNADNPVEHLWANQTLNREGMHLTRFSRLWSNMPWFRPLMTIIEDTVENAPVPPGGRHHHIFGAHCNPYFWLLALGKTGHPSCYENLVTAIAPFGLKPEAVHDNLNLFQKTRIDLDTDRRTTLPSDVRVGDYVDFFAEMNVLMAISACPVGSGLFAVETGNADTRPLGVEIYETGVDPLPFTYTPMISMI